MILIFSKQGEIGELAVIKKSGKYFWEINTSASMTHTAKVRIMHGDTADVFWNEIW